MRRMQWSGWTISAAGSAKGSLVARICGSTWPWGDRMGSRRVSSYSSRATRRTVGSGSKQRSGSRAAATALHDRRPAGSVLPLPVAHRLRVPLDPSRLGVGAQGAPGPLSDVAEVAQQDALRPFLNRLVQRLAGPNGRDEFGDVKRRNLTVAAGRERVGARWGDRFLHHLVGEIVHRVAVLVEDDAPRGALDDGAAGAVLRRERIAAQALPHDDLLPRELEAGFLRVRELPVVVEVVAAADRGDADGVVHPEGPPADIDLVRAVVADLPRAPAPKPVPVVVDDVVAVRRARRRALPQLVIEPGRDRGRLAAADSGSPLGGPGAGGKGAAPEAPPEGPG